MTDIVHVTAEGRTMLIQDMSNQHLINTARMLLKKANALKEMPSHLDRDEFTLGFINNDEIEEMDERMAGEEAGKLYRKACMYIAELYFREVSVHELRILMAQVAPKRNPIAVQAAPSADINEQDGLIL